MKSFPTARTFPIFLLIVMLGCTVSAALPAVEVTVPREGVPGEVIPRVAGIEKCDLIIMGSHGRTALANILLGSVAEHIFRHAPCPVLTVKTPEHEFIKDA